MCPGPSPENYLCIFLLNMKSILGTGTRPNTIDGGLSADCLLVKSLKKLKTPSKPFLSGPVSFVRHLPSYM